MRHVLAGVLIALLACSLLWAALPFTDTFTAADGTALATYNANWTVVTSTMGIFGNATGCTAGSSCLAKDNSNTYNSNQIATGTLKTPLAGTYTGVAINMTTGDNGYQCRADDNELTMLRRGTTSTLWSATTPTILDGDVISLWRNGNNVYCELTRSGVSQYASGPVADTTHTGGSPGIGGFGWVSSSTYTRIDDVTLNDYSGGGGSAPIRRRPIMMFFTLPELAQ